MVSTHHFFGFPDSCLADRRFQVQKHFHRPRLLINRRKKISPITMIGQAVRKAHILDLPDPVFTRFASFDIYSKVYCVGILFQQVAYNMAGVEPLAGAFHFCTTLLGLVPAFGLIGMAERNVGVLCSGDTYRWPDGLFGTFLPFVSTLRCPASPSQKPRLWSSAN